MQVTKRTFLKGLLATAAAGGVVSQASAKPQADLPAKWDREADVVILGYGGAGASAAITAKDAGADVGNSVRTIENHRAAAMKRLQIKTLAQLHSLIEAVKENKNQ